MSVVLSYYNYDGVNIPTSTTEVEFESLAILAKYCVLMGGIENNSEIIPIAIDKENKKVYDVTREFIDQYYQG